MDQERLLCCVVPMIRGANKNHTLRRGTLYSSFSCKTCSSRHRSRSFNSSRKQTRGTARSRKAFTPMYWTPTLHGSVSHVLVPGSEAETESEACGIAWKRAGIAFPKKPDMEA